jgi:hypothetical protein
MQLIVDILVPAKRRKIEENFQEEKCFTCVSICDGDKLANCCLRRLK